MTNDPHPPAPVCRKGWAFVGDAAFAPKTPDSIWGFEENALTDDISARKGEG